MSKILGIHTLELKPDITVEAFEQFAANDVPGFVQVTPGYSQRVYKGTKGDRVGKYVLIFHIEGDEARKRYFFSDEEREAFYKQLFQTYPDNQRIPETLKTLVDGFQTDFTSYDCIASTAPYQTPDDNQASEYLRIHELELKSGVTPEQFEQFCANVWSKTAWLDGETCYVGKGLKGVREGKYAFIITVEDEATQAIHNGSAEEVSAAYDQLFTQYPQDESALNELRTLATGFGTVFTNYSPLTL